MTLVLQPVQQLVKVMPQKYPLTLVACMSVGSLAPGQTVIGPSVSTDNNFASFDGPTGKILKDSGFAPSSFATAAQGAKADTAVQPSDLAPVATSGDYGDLLNPPAIPAYLDDLDTTVTGAELDAIRDRVVELDAAIVLKGVWNPTSGSFPSGANAGYSYIVSADGTVDGVTFNTNDRIIALVNNASTSTFANNWFKADYTDQVLSVAGKTGVVTLAASDITSGTLDNARLGDTGVSAGSYTFANITVNSKGLITAASNGNLISVPTGVISPFAGYFAPTGWLLCHGQSVSRSVYPDLYAVIGTTYGPGSAPGTTFNLPDLRGRVVAGKDDMGGVAANRLTNTGTGNPGINGITLGATGGADRHKLTVPQMPVHTHPHNIITALSTTAGNQNYQSVSGPRLFATTVIGDAGGDEAHPNVQPTMILNYIIKT